MDIAVYMGVLIDVVSMWQFYENVSLHRCKCMTAYVKWSNKDNYLITKYCSYAKGVLWRSFSHKCALMNSKLNA